MYTAARLRVAQVSAPHLKRVNAPDNWVRQSSDEHSDDAVHFCEHIFPFVHFCGRCFNMFGIVTNVLYCYKWFGIVKNVEYCLTKIYR